MRSTRFTDLMNCSVPIQQAPIGSFANPVLAAAVANAGGQGMVAITGAPPEVIAARLDEAQERTPGPVGANLFIAVSDPSTLPAAAAMAAHHAPLVDFFYGDPDPQLVRIVHEGGALAEWQVGSAEEARAAEAAGCDLIVAQGIEAGGHVRGRIGLFALLDEVLPAVSIPVLAAGGIGTGRAMAAALAAGADGVRVGTRFVAAAEAGAHPRYVDALIGARPADTVLGDYFSYEFPGLPHRALRASVEAAHAYDGEIVGEIVDPATGEVELVHRLEKVTVTQHTKGTIEAMSHWAGESVRGVERRQTAAEIVDELVTDAEAQLQRWCDAT